MIASARKFPPVASDLPLSVVRKALFSRRPVTDCLEEIARYLGVKRLIPVNSGRTALFVILKSLLPEGSKILLPGYTCYTVAASVVKAGMVPILVDSDPEDLGYNLDSLKKNLARYPDAEAILVSHLFGIPVNIDQIRNIVGSKMLIIDDAAQGYGIKNDDRFLGTAGDCGFYSFGRGKNLALGGGGLIVTNNNSDGKKISDYVSSFLDRGTLGMKGMVSIAAYNFATSPVLFNIMSRLPGIELAKNQFTIQFETATAPAFMTRLLYRMYDKAEIQNRNRLEISARYMELLGSNDSLSIPRSRLNGQPGCLRFPILMKDASKKQAILKKEIARQLGLSAMYPRSLNRVDRLSSISSTDLKGAEYIARSIITLPTHRFIRAYDRQRGLTETIAGLLV